ncbi:profilin [Streptomyces solisilvae]|uniref:profilin n=1 Tax=Streptomyces malaysiensis TaxID=92644 RepID=UPI0036762307
MAEWQRCVDDRLVGSGKVSRAAILGRDSEVLAASKGYELSARERSALAGGAEDLEQFQGTGLHLGGKKFVINGVDDRSLFCRKEADGAIVVVTNRSIIVTEYDAPILGAEAVRVTEQLADELIAAGD